VKPGQYTITRRELIGMGVATVGATLLSGCQVIHPADGPADMPLISPTLVTRVKPPTLTAGLGTTVPLSSQTQEAFMYVPTGYKASVAAPFVLMFHAEQANALSALNLFQPYADAHGLVLLAVESYYPSWDVISTGDYGPDVQFTNDALAAAFNEVNVDPSRVTVEGFSDGASYALAMGRTNGDLFSKVVSFSASFMPPYTPLGMPKFFMAQGIGDQTFDITESGDLIDSKLVAAGYNVDYVRFDGVHEVPDAIVQQAIAFIVS